MNYIRQVCILLICFIAGTASAQQVVPFDGEFGPIGDKLEILTDSGGNMSLQEAMKSTRYKNSADEFPNLGTTPYAYWVRFSLKNLTDGKTAGIQMTQAMTDYLDFYELKGDTVTRVNFTGHKRPFNNRYLKNQTFIYQIPFSAGDTRTIYFRAQSGKQLMLPIYLGTIEKVLENSLVIDMLFGVYVGILMVMILYNLFVYSTVRDRSYLYYVMYLVVVLLTQASMQGYVFRLVLPDYPAFADIFVYFSTALIGIAAIEFSKHFLSTKHYTPKLHKVSYLFYILYCIQILLALLGYFNFSYTLMLMLAMCSAIYVLYMAVVIQFKGLRSAKFFLIAWGGFIFCVVIYVLKDLNFIVPYNNITNFALLIGSAFESIMLSFALADKINILKSEKEQSQMETMHVLRENERIIREQNVVLEARVTERTAELNNTLEDLKQTQSQLVESEKMASLGQLTAGIAHEINNPINFVTSNINPLKRDVDMLLNALEEIESVGLSDRTIEEKKQIIEEFKDDLDFDYLKIEIDQLMKGINEGASRTAEIVKGLRIFSRVDEDDLKKADINEGLDSTMIIANNLLNNNIKVVMEQAELPRVECYAGKLNQVFLNIISNGIHAIHEKFGEKPGGELYIKTYADEESVYLSIKDNGIGMSAETQRKIFEPFFTTKDVGEGTGLGMSIAYNTIKKHKGDINVVSSPGEGSVFILRIPISFSND
ncbi:MAG: sensor histidine kinase [Arcticibacter sp.]